ncbi:MAG: NADH-quinone oxidoreductase subunit J [Caulobacteraceae bacterium]
MLVQAIAFYLLAATTLCAGLAVISARNPVHSVLALIAAFFAAAGLFVLLGAEFLAMILVIVYVGAVAVLFLFVVMMLDVDFSALRAGFARYLPIGGAIAALLTVEMVIAAAAVAHGGAGAGSHGPQTFVGAESNTRAIGQVLYTNYVYLFEAAGMVLLVAMIGAIVLTLKHRVGIKRQVIARQVARSTDGMRLVDIKPGEGAEVG